MNNTTITLEEYGGFKRAYNKAVKAKKDQFTYKHKTFLTNYAKYLLEYMHSLIKSNHANSRYS